MPEPVSENPDRARCVSSARDQGARPQAWQRTVEASQRRDRAEGTRWAKGEVLEIGSGIQNGLEDVMQISERSRRPHLSIVIPAYNEARRLERSLRSIAGFLARLDHSRELVIVDDGSSDGTFEVIQSIGAALDLPVRGIRYEVNRGKGYALKVGFAHARGERILFADADLATPIEELSSLYVALEEGCDIAIGSRKMAGAEIRVHQPWVREQMGKVFTWLVRTFLADVSDATCGFKMFRGEVGRDLFSRLRVDDWAFDAELLFLARRRGYRIAEVPVSWEDQSGTKVRLLRDAWSSARGLLRIVWNQRRGLYDEANSAREGVAIWTHEGARALPDVVPVEAQPS
jgi:dolichyl-phosphate beta-glucosyltransferase